jgi:hypothetical protein
MAGDNNTAIGYEADVSSGNISNATVIGNGAEASMSNTVALGNENVTRWAFGLTTTGANRAIEVGLNATNGNGAYLTDGGTWTNTSDRNKKEDFQDIDRNELLVRIGQLNIQRWKYKTTDEYHIGPYAQEFNAAFEVGLDDQGLSTIDPAGVALAAIQELIIRLETQDQLIRQLENRILELESD